MCKVVIDSFENQENAAAFINWLSHKMMDGEVNLRVLKGMQVAHIQIAWDGVDQDQTNNKQIVVNITTC